MGWREWTIVVLFFAALMWWFERGADIALRTAQIGDVLLLLEDADLVGQGARLLLIFAVILYPVVGLFALMIIIISPGMTKQILFSRGSLWGWLAPVTVPLFIVYLYGGSLLVGLFGVVLVWGFWLGYPVYCLVKAIRSGKTGKSF